MLGSIVPRGCERQLGMQHNTTKTQQQQDHGINKAAFVLRANLVYLVSGTGLFCSLELGFHQIPNVLFEEDEDADEDA